jgi:hypothetical protein
MRGTTAIIETRCPTRQELDECQKYYLSDPEYWDPDNVQFTPDKRIESVTSSSASITPPFTDLSVQQECQRAICNLSLPRNTTNYPPHATLNDFGGKNILISDRHHEITPEMLSRKWGCGLKTARATLDHAT